MGKARNLLNCLLYEIEQREKKLTDQEQELFRLITFEYKDLDKNQKRVFKFSFFLSFFLSLLYVFLIIFIYITVFLLLLFIIYLFIYYMCF